MRNLFFKVEDRIRSNLGDSEIWSACSILFGTPEQYRWLYDLANGLKPRKAAPANNDALQMNFTIEKAAECTCYKLAPTTMHLSRTERQPDQCIPPESAACWHQSPDANASLLPSTDDLGT